MPISKPWTVLALGAALGGLWWVADIQNGYAETVTADPALARGEQIARQKCAACHVVAGDQKFPPVSRSREPSFREIASRPTTTQASVQKFITTTHWDHKRIPITMPDPKLTPEEAVAVSGYIMSLRKQ